MHRDCAVCTYSGTHVILWGWVHDVWFNCSDAGICNKTEIAHLSLNIGKVRVPLVTVQTKIHYQKFTTMLKSEALAEGGAHKVYTLYHKFTSPTLKSSSVLQHFKCSDAHVGQFLTRAHLASFPGPAQLSHVGRAWERGCHTLCQLIWTCMQTHTRMNTQWTTSLGIRKADLEVIQSHPLCRMPIPHTCVHMYTKAYIHNLHYRISHRDTQ